MKRMQFEAGTGRKFEIVNFVIGKYEGKEVYAEVEVPEEVDDDYGYLTMKKAVESQIGDRLEWQYDGQEENLTDDADADCEVYVDIED